MTIVKKQKKTSEIFYYVVENNFSFKKIQKIKNWRYTFGEYKVMGKVKRLNTYK